MQCNAAECGVFSLRIAAHGRMTHAKFLTQLLRVLKFKLALCTFTMYCRCREDSQLPVATKIGLIQVCNPHTSYCLHNSFLASKRKVRVNLWRNRNAIYRLLWHRSSCVMISTVHSDSPAWSAKAIKASEGDRSPGQTSILRNQDIAAYGSKCAHPQGLVNQ